MTQLTRHKALVEDVAKAMFFNQHSIMHDHDELWRKAEGAFIFRENAEIALSLIATRLADVTDEMVEAWKRVNVNAFDSDNYIKEGATADWRAMLSASALVSGREG